LKKMAISLRTLREDVNIAEEATKTKQELDALKATLEEALMSAEGKLADELLVKKRAVDSINVEQLEIRNIEEWKQIRTELNALKEDLKSKEIDEHLRKNEVAELRAQFSSCDDSTSTGKIKEKKWKNVFTRIRRGKYDDNSKSSAAIPATNSTLSAKSAPRIKSAASTELKAARTATSLYGVDSDDEADDDADQDNGEVETIPPPGLLRAKLAPIIKKSGSESDDGADDKSITMTMKLKLYPSAADEMDIKSSKSMKSTTSKSVHTTKSTHTSVTDNRSDKSLKSVRSSKSTHDNNNTDSKSLHKSKSTLTSKSAAAATAASSKKSVQSTLKSFPTLKTAKSSQSLRSTGVSTKTPSTPKSPKTMTTKKTHNIAQEVEVDPETGEITMKSGKTLDMFYERFEEEKKTEEDVDNLWH